MQRGSRLVPVHVSGWEIGCCVPPPGIDDRVSWFLFFSSPPDPTSALLDEPGLMRRRWQVQRCLGGVIVVDGPVEAGWLTLVGPAPEPGVVELAGQLVTDFHGGAPDALRPVSGRVRRVRVCTQLLQETEASPGLMAWVSGSVWTYDVTRSPKCFDRRPPENGAPRRQETGVLVDLEV